MIAVCLPPPWAAKDSLQKKGETAGGSSANNLRQFDVNVLNETDFIETSDSIEIVARFTIFQLEKPVSQWRYNFNLEDFKAPIEHIDQNCTSINLIALI